MKQFNTLLTQCAHIEHTQGVWIKNIFDKMTAMITVDIFQACVEYIGLCLCYDSAYSGGSTRNTVYYREIRYFVFTIQAHCTFV